MSWFQHWLLNIQNSVKPLQDLDGWSHIVNQAWKRSMQCVLCLQRMLLNVSQNSDVTGECCVSKVRSTPHQGNFLTPPHTRLESAPRVALTASARVYLNPNASGHLFWVIAHYEVPVFSFPMWVLFFITEINVLTVYTQRCLFFSSFYIVGQNLCLLILQKEIRYLAIGMPKELHALESWGHVGKHTEARKSAWWRESMTDRVDSISHFWAQMKTFRTLISKMG